MVPEVKQQLLFFISVYLFQVVFSPSAVHSGLLGSTIVMDCEGVKNTGTEEIKWTFVKDMPAKHSMLYRRDKQGLVYRKDDPKMIIAKNMSLVINDFNKDNEGLYLCEVCQGISSCTVTTSECILGKISKLWEQFHCTRVVLYK